MQSSHLASLQSFPLKIFVENLFKMCKWKEFEKCKFKIEKLYFLVTIQISTYLTLMKQKVRFLCLHTYDFMSVLVYAIGIVVHLSTRRRTYQKLFNFLLKSYNFDY